MLSSKIIVIGALLVYCAMTQSKREFIAPNHDAIAYVLSLKAPEATEESRIKIVSKTGNVLLDTSFSSEDGEHGLGVVKASWTPNSKFFVFSTSSSGGHQPWHSPTFFYSVKLKKLIYLDDLVGVITTPDFVLSAEDSLYTIGKRKDDLEDEDFAIKLSKLIHLK
jgi:hypothetical protein